MKEHSTTIGIDVGDRVSQVCEIDNGTGEVLSEATVKTEKRHLQHVFSRMAARVVLEVGGQAGWISRLLTELGHDVLIADPRKARQLMGKAVKDDRVDAELLARFGRADPKLLRPVTLRQEETQCELGLLRSRDQLVGARTKLINHVRGTVKSLGQRLPTKSSASFHTLSAAIPRELRRALQPMMTVIETLTEQIRTLDKAAEAVCDARPAAGLLREVPGVGPITALAFVLTVERPERFRKSRQVGAYFGLCPKRYQSGMSAPELRITKTGDAFVRRLLIQASQYILGRFGPDSDLRRWGLRYAEHGGRTAKKKAVVAVARKLAVMLHRMWVTGAVYQPQRHSVAAAA